MANNQSDREWGENVVNRMRCRREREGLKSDNLDVDNHIFALVKTDMPKTFYSNY